MTIAFAHPGKMGDLLFALPTALSISRRQPGPVHFFTSEYCRPLVTLLEFQSWIDEVIVPQDYQVEAFSMGVQPWQMPVPQDRYEGVFQLGIRSWPQTNMIDFYAGVMEVPPAEYVIEGPDTAVPDGTIVLAGCRRTNPLYVRAVAEHFKEKAPVFHVGGTGFDTLAENVVNTEFPDLLATAALLKKAKVYAGGIGVNSVMALAFPNLKAIIAHPEGRMDTSHIVYRDHAIFLYDPTLEDYVREVERAWQA